MGAETEIEIVVEVEIVEEVETNILFISHLKVPATVTDQLALHLLLY